MRVEVKVKGVARTTHRCARCGKPIEGDPIFIHGSELRAVHPDCMSKENTDGR